MVIYLDVLIFENSIVNTFLLYITAQTLRIKVKMRYLILAGIFGGLYVIVLVIPTLKIFSSLIFKIIAAFLMIIICFRKKSLRFNIKALAVLIMYSMVTAGLCFFIELNNTRGSYFNAFIGNVSYKWILIAIMIIYMFVNRIIWFINDRKLTQSLIYEIEICFKDNSKFINAFLDTGNELREPITNLPVIVVEKDMVSGIKWDDCPKFYVPFRLFNGKAGNLEAFKPSYVKIYIGDKVEVRNAIIALIDNKLSSLNDYNALLSRGSI
ncbi:stage II sporulation protein GA (sporulation sigma-E factor processing peptidase) [Clostridium acetobutylicum]|uniref:Probable sporulation sigma-E factor-processing peptidase n=1 Tax=Clostridium acetobutylicum (strain ATCC 824 / DSM 792 / JCM 1419 / IAM 19013 / LMG 5710 / NBRC 13948 / NRRL B-527 / VKM B-1787 / 2291 / W) TaxID=272562 RepID=SP2G_CLOAB|nr:MULTISPECIES: sigma-E processing peptidase SpoIIGA [Clostridium]Q45832.1 RecName: Full=Probable sporulation sigma-E factor-processing peptidase; AltName: Full=Membrane-associated aspartic protease; AltName: Full=Stage II sporulation protein GA [Clostridium acetobutylicum ATCC 824]AAK79660.1 Sigma factor E processing enzyme, SpoIIGA [Clostridium acetobutylicum ATCC 824]ADZ20744.1 Sigma factor E processing enzyme, SpoIIGA [Clostridium acetobutylicum EA 2018]AEI33515.1 sigma factor E processing